MSDITITGIVGSLRAASVNRTVAETARGLMPDGARLELQAIDAVPLFNQDVESVGAPDAVAALRDAVDASGGIILFSPEYNGSFPAVTKNVIDWLSRPPHPWEATAITMVTASPGGRAGLGVRTHFSDIMQRQPVRLFDTYGFGTYGDKLDADGALVDPDTLAELTDFLARFAAFAASE